jgi:hypothetical protein
LATTERSSPLYLYRFSVSTPCAPINPILLGRARRRPGRSEVEGTGVVEKLWKEGREGDAIAAGLESGGVAAAVPRAARRRGLEPGRIQSQ